MNFLELEFYPLPRTVTVYSGAGESANVPIFLREYLRKQLAETYAWMSQA